jgi:gliding motility-associated-like protein
MKQLVRLSSVLLMALALFTAAPLRAAHLIGGELNYTCLNDSTYRIDLVIYRDCAGGGAGFDNPAYIFVYDAAGVYQSFLQLTAPSITLLPVTSDNPCLSIPPGICVERGVYSGVFFLPPNPDGYSLVYQRCCRNSTIDNLVDPGGTGSSYIETIPPFADAVCNSSPVFNNFPPIVLCAGEPITFDHSATDLDGDSLVYALCAPYSGASPSCPFPSGPFTPPGCPDEPPSPPYPPISYLAGFSAFNPLPGVPGLSIDPVSGLLTGTPNVPGQYVVGVCAQEYRDGVLINTHVRDFQFNVADCEPTVVASIPDFILDCEDRTISFDNSSSGASLWFWDFGVPGLTSDTASAFEPAPFTYPDTGTYTLTLIANPGFLCADTAYATVAIYPTLIGGWTFNAGCSGLPVLFSDTSVSTLAGVIDSWIWTFGDGSGSNEQNPSHEYEDGGNYTVTLIVGTSRGCLDTIVQVVNVAPGPDAAFAVADICQDQPALFDNQTTISTGTVTAWFWDFGNGEGSTEESPEYFYPVAGSYTVTLIAESANGCTDTAFQELLVGFVPLADAGPGATVEYLTPYTLNGSGGGSYLWSPSTYLDDPTAEDPVFTAWETTTFTVVVTSPDSCSVLDTVTVFVLPKTVVDVPTAFSPNGDGANDLLLLLVNDVEILYYFRIYNRWGQLLFETRNLLDGWDGTFKGIDQEVGTYVYTVSALGAEGDQVDKRGTVVLVR